MMLGKKVIDHQTFKSGQIWQAIRLILSDHVTLLYLSSTKANWKMLNIMRGNHNW